MLHHHGHLALDLGILQMNGANLKIQIDQVQTD